MIVDNSTARREKHGWVGQEGRIKLGTLHAYRELNHPNLETLMNPAPQLNASIPVGELAVLHAGASRVFHRHGLDFCCGGQIPLSEACAAKDLDADQLIKEIEAEVGESTFRRWDSEPLHDLLDHILDTYHAAHREEVPRLIDMAKKVERVHAAKEACPKGVAGHLERMAVELEMHMQKEEQVLFPMIRSGNGHMAIMPVQVMEQEHHDHGANLQELRSLGHNYTPPEEACGTWRALYLGLEQLERDLMSHIHLENSVLFPRALRS